MKTTALKPKKILLLTENFPPLTGGSGRWFWELYSRLPKNQILVVTNLFDDKENHYLDDLHSFSIERMPLSASQWGLKSFIGLNFYFKSVMRLYKIIKKNNVSEIHCGRVLHEGVIGWLLSLITDVKYCCYVHGEDVEMASISREHNLMVKQVCGRSDYLVCNSNNSANTVVNLNYASRDKLHVMHPGVDSERFFPTASDQSFKERMGWSNKFVILTVGRLQKRKGHDKMIEAMPFLLKDFPNLIYAIVGEGECKNELKQLACEMELLDNVQFLGEISDSDMISCYQQCDLFILPNRAVDKDIEGFGMVLVEAQSCGKPVVAGDSGGTSETMLVGVSGIVIDCSVAKNIADSIAILISDAPKLVRMGANGRRHVKDKLNWEAHVIKAKRIFNL